MKNHLTEHAGQCKTVGVDRRLVIVALPLKLVQSEAGAILSFFFSSFFFFHMGLLLLALGGKVSSISRCFSSS